MFGAVEMCANAMENSDPDYLFVLDRELTDEEEVNLMWAEKWEDTVGICYLRDQNQRVNPLMLKVFANDGEPTRERVREILRSTGIKAFAVSPFLRN